MKILKFLIITICLSFSFNAFGQYQALVSQNQQALAMQNALQEVMLKQGNLTKKDYDDFWNKVGATTPQEKNKAIGSIKKSFLAIQEYNREMWICAEKAWMSSKIEPCAKAEEKIQLLKKDAKMKEQLQLIAIVEENFQKIIKSSANKTDMISKDGTNMGKLTLESIRFSRDNTQKTLDRFNQLLAVEFIEKK